MTSAGGSRETRPVVIVGAGPAGLTAAYHLARNRRAVVVLEADPEYVGGISRTIRYKGHCFDIGGHRFFSKSQTVEQLWDEWLPHDFLRRRRSSRIYYRRHFFAYPLKPFDALSKLGVWESFRCVLSYLRAHIHPHPSPANFEQWVVNRFGRRLFEVFFKTYTEKVWGIPCTRISADWAAQRIKGLSLGTALANAFLPRKQPADKSRTITTLIDTFRYPRQGPGMMWEAVAQQVRDRGGEVRMGCAAKRFDARTGGHWHVVYDDRRGGRQTIDGCAIVCSAPLAQSVPVISPPLRSAARAAQLRYRDFLIVAVILRGEPAFDDNWIYIHDPSVRVGRVQNFKSWSPEMSPEGTFCLGLEYFCFENDGLWSMSDDDLLVLARRELQTLELVPNDDIIDYRVVRQPKAYPVYDDNYAAIINEIRDELHAEHPTFHLAGRNGMHKYNNQDHAMMTGLIAAENILAGRMLRDPWQVNADAEYHEEGEVDLSGGSKGTALREVPKRIR